jgi:hypothetical protein
LSSGLYGGKAISGTPMRPTRSSRWPGAPSHTSAAISVVRSSPRTTPQNCSPRTLSSQQYQSRPLRASTARKSER